MPNLLVIGIGNEFRGDDMAGLLVARQVKARSPDHTHVCEANGEGVALMELWQHAETVILIDAVQAGGTPGTIYRLDARAEKIPSKFFHYSTHAFSVAEAVELARALDQLPSTLIVYGIEGRQYDVGSGLSPMVEQAVSEVVERVVQTCEVFKKRPLARHPERSEGSHPKSKVAQGYRGDASLRSA